MVLVDTSVWVDHLRSTNSVLVALLEQGRVLMHPMVIGELACGNLHNRHALIALLHKLPHAVETSHSEALHCLEHNCLMGKGTGWIDIHLLASVLLTPGTSLWTKDRRLRAVAEDLQLCWKPSV
ncbi:MAG: type II toxin-antitoxin system VapC family toxin [Gammaproteobacteria bacterium]|nr:type II toxin-antitoxin system VapC family toxin [Gammaproteobacteria bacterium]